MFHTVVSISSLVSPVLKRVVSDAEKQTTFKQLMKESVLTLSFKLGTLTEAVVALHLHKMSSYSAKKGNDLVV